MEEPKDEIKDLPRDLPEEIPAHVANALPQAQNSNQSQNLRTLLSWHAPGRPYRRKTKQFFLTVILIAFLVEVILFLFSQHALMFVVLSLVFLSFVFAIIPPRNFQYRISTQGIMLEDHFYIWDELYDFYFTKRNGIDILNVRTKDFFPGVLTITLGDITKDHVKEILAHYLPFREYIKPTFMEKSADWLVHNFPLEKPQ